MAQSVPLYQRPKPRLRGRLHEIAFFIAIPAGVVLIVLAPGPVARAGAVVYWLALLSQFGVSAWYHLGKWSERAHERMRRLDHSTIFLLIAGTYTPFCLLALHGTASLVLLAVVWIGAAAGILTKLYRTDLNVLSGFLYIGLGWAAIFAMPSLVHALTTAELVLLISGGIAVHGRRARARDQVAEPVPANLRVPRDLAQRDDRRGGLLVRRDRPAVHGLSDGLAS